MLYELLKLFGDAEPVCAACSVVPVVLPMTLCVIKRGDPLATSQSQKQLGGWGYQKVVSLNLLNSGQRQLAGVSQKSWRLLLRTRVRYKRVGESKWRDSSTLSLCQSNSSPTPASERLVFPSSQLFDKQPLSDLSMRELVLAHKLPLRSSPFQQPNP